MLYIHSLSIVKEQEQLEMDRNERKLEFANEQLNNMNQKVEELASKTFSKEENKDMLMDENLRLREEVYRTAQKLEKVSLKLEKLAENNDLLKAVVKQISGNAVAKKGGKVKQRTMVTPRPARDTSQHSKSSGNLGMICSSIYFGF